MSFALVTVTLPLLPRIVRIPFKPLTLISPMGASTYSCGSAAAPANAWGESVSCKLTASLVARSRLPLLGMVVCTVSMPFVPPVVAVGVVAAGVPDVPVADGVVDEPVVHVELAGKPPGC